mgnify:CR=1 FL=1
MKEEIIDKITSVILFLVIIGIFAVVIVFSIIAIQEIWGEDEDLVFAESSGNVATSGEKTVEDDIEVPAIVENPISSIETNNNTNTDYSNVQVDKYFYNQLEEKSRIIYRAFESNKEQMKTGTYQIELGDSFSDTLSQSNGQEQLGEYYQSAIEAYTYDNPEVFYLSPKKMYLNIETTTRGGTTTYNVFINSGNEANYLAEEFNSKEEIDQAIAQIEQVKNQIVQNRTGNTYEDIKMVHDYLVDNISYDSSLSKQNIYNIYGALVNRECVCEGYARAFKYLLDELDIPCVMVIGTGTNSQGETENHAWNYVQLNGNWYAVDSTWDDPVVIGGGTASEESRYKYFLVGREIIDQDHSPSGQFTEGGKVFSYPNVSYESYSN